MNIDNIAVALLVQIKAWSFYRAPLDMDKINDQDWQRRARELLA